MKAIILATMIMLSVSLSGCRSHAVPPPVVPVPTYIPPVVTSVPIPINPVPIITTAIPVGSPATGIIPAGEVPAYLPNGTMIPAPIPPDGMEWGIYPAKVTIANMSPGAEADYYVGVYNGGTLPANFSVIARNPDKLDTGYVALPLSWVTITPSTLTVKGKTTTNVSVIIKIPFTSDGGRYFAGSKKYQVYIGARNVSVGGNIIVENASNWRIELKP
jgi:hypothetical protein